MAGELISTNTAGAQYRARYDATNYADFTVSSGGDLTIAPSGLDTTISGNLSVSSGAAVGGTFSATGATTLSSTLAVTGIATLSASETRFPATHSLRYNSVTRIYVDASKMALVGGTSGIEFQSSAGAVLADIPDSKNLRFRNSTDSMINVLGIDGSNRTTITFNSTEPNITGTVWSTAALGSYVGKIGILVDGAGPYYWPVYN